jgi:LEA14-like dessication related protein
MTKTKHRLWLGCLAGAVFFSGCAYLNEFLKAAQQTGAGDLAAFLQPTLKFKSADVTGLSLTGMGLTTKWELGNDNGVALDLASVDYALLVNGVSVVSGKPPTGLQVPAKGVAELAFPADVQFINLASTLTGFLLKDSSTYEVKGNVGLNTPIGVVTLPFTYGNVFSVPKIPELQLQNPRVGGITLTGASVEFPLLVTNKNSFPLPIQQVTGTLSIAGTSVGSVSTGNLGVLNANGNKTVVMPLTINFLSAGMAVAKIIQGGTADVKFDANVESGAAKLPINLAQSLTFLKL